MAIEELGITISAQTRDAERGLENVADEAQQLGVSAALAQGRTDELGDELTELGVKAVPAAAGLSATASSASGLSVSATAAGTSTTGLAVALGTLAAAAGPAAAGLGTAAAAAGGLALGFGTVIGTGIISHQAELQEALAESRAEIMATAEEIGDEFGPGLVRAVELLPEFTNNVLAALGPLDPFEETLSELGRIGFEFGPQLASQLGDIGRDALPSVEEGAQFLVDEFPGALELLRENFEEVQPELEGFAQAALRAGPPLLEFSTNLAELLLPTLGFLTEGITAAVRSLNTFISPLTDIQGELSGLAPIMRDTANVFGAASTPLATASNLLGDIAREAGKAARNLERLNELTNGPLFGGGGGGGGGPGGGGALQTGIQAGVGGLQAGGGFLATALLGPGALAATGGGGGGGLQIGSVQIQANSRQGGRDAAAGFFRGLEREVRSINIGGTNFGG